MDLNWFKFNPAKWMMGRIKKCSPEAKAEFIDLCCTYWTKLCQMDIDTARSECDTYDELVRRSIIKEQDGMIAIDFLDQQIEELSDKSAYFSELGKRSAKSRAERKVNARSTHVDQPLNETSTDKIDKIDKIDREIEANFSNENSGTIFFDENGIDIQPNNQPTETRGDVAPRTKNLVGLSDDSLKFLEWFKSQFDTKGITWTENATKEARRGYDKSIQRLKAMPDNEGLSDNELKGLIAKIIIFIKSDKFWSTAFISPAKLLKSNREGINYFELFVNEYRQKSPELAKQRRDAETDRLIRNNEAQRERMKHEASQF